jgi:hypothetical protein
VCAVGLAACGGGGGDEAAERTTATAEPATTEEPVTTATTAEAAGPPPGGEYAEYCAAAVQMELGVATVDFEADIAEVARQLLTLATPVAAVAPADVAPTLTEATTVLQQMADTGDTALGIRVDEAFLTAHAFDRANCGWTVTDVTTSDHAYAGLPASLEAGTHSFEITNPGLELHELRIARLPDATTPWLELVESGAAVPVARGGAEPGTSGYAVADLTPGRYVAYCPVLLGTTAQEYGTGDPHHTQGQAHEFTVA